MTEGAWAFRVKALLFALAIGGGTVVAATLAVSLPFHGPLSPPEEWDGYLLEMLVVALPFAVLALLAERSRVLWGSALAVTFLPWGYYVFEAISYRMEGSSVLAHMGFDVLLPLCALVVTPILAGTSLVRKYLIRSARTGM
jgi:hypothetical protein